MTQKILFKDGLRIGKRELQLLQANGLGNLSGLAQAMSAQLPAVITATSGVLSTELQATASGTNVSVATGSALLMNGALLVVPTALTLAVPSGTTSQPLVLYDGGTPYGSGTIAIGASDRYTLTYTPASGSSLSALDFYAANSAIRLVNGVTSLGTFRVASVTSSTITLLEPVPGSTALSGLLHAPAGQFFPGYPNVGETTDLLVYNSPALRIEVSGYTAGTNEIILANISRSGSTVQVSDARMVFQVRGLGNIVDSMVAANASIAESKLALSPELLKAKQVSAHWFLNANNEPYTDTPNIYVTRDGVLKRVMTESDASTPAFAGLAVSPATASMAVGDTKTITASVNAQSGASVTYTMTSSNTSVVSVSQSPAGSATGTLTAVATGSATITVVASAPAVGSFTAQTQTVTLSVDVGTSTGVITGLSFSPSPLSLNMTSGGQQVTVSVTSPVQSPSVTYTWSLVDNAGTLVSLSSTSGATITVTPKQAGSGRLQVSATSQASGNYTGNTKTATLDFSVSAGLTLLAEPGYRVYFFKTDQNTSHARVRWGVGGTVTGGSGLSVQVSVGTDDADVNVGLNALAGQGFYSSNGYKYVIATNTAVTVNTRTATLTLTKVYASDPNPATSGSFVIRSLAVQYQIEVNYGATQYYQSASISGSGGVREYAIPPGTTTNGTTYTFRLKAQNSGLVPSEYNNDLSKAWGASSAGTVTIPSTWVSATPTSSSVIFSWDLLKTNGYNQTTMDYYAQWRVGSNDWSGWTRIDDSTTGNTLTQTIAAPASTAVVFRLKITDLAGNSVNGTAYDAEISSTTTSGVGNGTVTEKNYPFTLSSNTTWTEITPGSGRYVAKIYELTSGLDTSFITGVTVERIDLFFSTALAQSSGTAVLKVLVYPTGNPGSQIASNLYTQGDAPYASTPNISTVLEANPNTAITVALEYATSGNPNSLDPTGIGQVLVWYQGLSG